MKLARLLLLGHLAALAFGVAGLLLALPHPEWWAADANARAVFAFGMSYGGPTYILFGAAAMFAFAWATLGRRRTLIFLVAATTLTLAAELIGTGAGWPFGNYAYTSFLGPKALGRVPFTIPLSWFYMGLASFILGSLLAARIGHRRTLWSLALGVWLLTAWDLALDPAMAAPTLRAHFWLWHQTGPYFGMPLQNLIGWSATGLLYMGVSRLLWRSDLALASVAPRAWFPVAVYAANLFFAMALSLGAGLWPPVLLAAGAGLAPALIALNTRRAPDRAPLGERRWIGSPSG